MYSDSDTIVAIATAPGRGGIGILRVSGPLAPRLAQAVTGKQLAPRHATFTSFRDANGDLIDRGLALLFPQPVSFTGEDVVEFHLHGNRFVLGRLLRDLTVRGARLAEPGEFSARAFLHGKMDLAQAEALADLVNAASDQAARAAVASMEGKFSERVWVLVHELTRLRVLVEANLDFAEDETGYVLQPLLGAEIAAVDAALQKLLDAAKNGRALQEGCRVVIMGKPNAGKSSLLNALSQTDSAIVSDLPGTTRDPVATTVILDGMPVHVTDTAGLREATDAIEAEGIRRAYATAKQADIVLLVTDGEAGIDPDELATLRTHSSTATCIIVVNKIDLFDMSPRIESLDPEQRVYLSAKSGAGVDLLQALIERHCGQVDGGNSFSARQRHLDCLRLAREALQPLLHSNHGINLPDDLVAECLRDAQAALGEITGTVTTEALLGEIFQTFCIGK